MKRNPNKTSLPTRRAASGFTLVEMLLVLVILGILASIVYPMYAKRGDEGRKVATRVQIRAVTTALAAFEMDNGYYPKGRDGLAALLQRPSNAPNWRGPYLESVPKDGWGNDFSYECPGRHNPNTYDVVSMGPDRNAGTEDDIGNWPAVH
jgi:general secretion pathway protein G